ncbi:hypothetical protein KS4_21190 [Poriferisphaera corsica]|uniref:IrrE N-terminal-like domain-containing protein n=1 Tax=Poriferisphaera corsica TaxID=2528020 RepID=A0A517YV02_9BACT|nr:hypothetical protein [Poriferisphaera corsica]QDU34057.1 hypothetical protein KS4_21190 [Poriferisphaera corsica]
MEVKVGPHVYRIILAKGIVRDEAGDPYCGLTFFDHQTILISGQLKPSKRLSTLWHELVHAFAYELDIAQSDTHDEESMCNLIGLAMSQLDAMTLARLHVYMLQGIDCDAVMMSPKLEQPIPVLQLLSDQKPSRAC